ncbi:PEP/pyruvate-binding domain-containing protein [Halomarina ordinaria]|uniref:Probable phosphoenolpyruvate synthase n=1 Tax=Halomarina ordinaria TaxID=3033939 RepID=A0ABD5UBI5_9EURY|nr:PEP/pyruvate-binding domain-containing protein [Halomarina sp. PSRA2]
MRDREPADRSGAYVVTLTDTRATDPRLTGGKGANLSRLARSGIPVPSGFCVTTVAYRHLLDDESVQTAIRDLSEIDPADTAAVGAAGATLRTRIEALEIPPAIREAIQTALGTSTAASDSTYAIRSSATAEDLPEASFAGQQETFLNVHGTEAVVDRVRDCMASLFTDRAITYRAKNDIPHEDVALAVVVQEMVTPDASGILFTADPVSGNRRVTAIEAGRGLGEAFVSGEATPDSIRVDTHTGDLLDYDVGDQRVAVRARPEGGTETVELSSSVRTARVLTDEQVRTLVALGARIDALFDPPQDIEWALEDGTFSIVQSRPITTLFPVPSPAPTDDRLHVYYSVGHAQAFPEAMPPLVRDVWLTYTQAALGAFGLTSRSPVGVEAGGRVYVDITGLLRIDALRDDVPDILAEVSEPMGAAVEDVLRRRGDEFRTERTTRERLTALPAVVRIVWKSARGLPFVWRAMSGFVRAFVGAPNPPEYEEALWTDWGEEMASQVTGHGTLAERVHAPFDLIGTAAAVTSFPRTGPLFAALVADAWLRTRFPDAPEDVNAVGRGFPRELVTRINLGLGDLADVARDHPAVADALQQGASLDEVEACEGGDVFREAFEAYLDEFGHRATGELDLSRPRWREDPSGLLATIRANLEHGDGESADHRQHIQRMEREALAAADRLEQRANRGLLGPVRERLVRQVIRTYRGYIQTREYPKQGAAHLFTAWRDVLRAGGEVLASEGQLATSDDIWFLRRDELLSALRGEPLAVDIDRRRAEFGRHASMTAPPVVTSEGEAPRPEIDRTDVPDGTLVGTGVSGGVVEGVARVVRDPSEETIEKGEILVAPSSDPGWTPLFLNAAGLVSEVGGRMSHGALVAREYGLPAVVSVPDATRRITTGQRVRVDGSTGRVELIE